MLICGTHIDSKEIIGIGELLSQRSTDPDRNMRQLSFMIYLKNYSAKIESPWLDLGQVGSKNAQDLQAQTFYHEFVKQHRLSVISIENKIKDRRIRKQPAKPKKSPIKKAS